MEPEELWFRVREIGGESFCDFAFGPAIDVIWDWGIADAAELQIIADDRGDLVFIDHTQPGTDPGEEAVASLDHDRAVAGDAESLQQSPMRRITMMQPGTHHCEIKCVVGIRERLGVLVTPLIRRELVRGHPGVEVGHRDIAEAELFEDFFICRSAADDQNAHVAVDLMPIEQRLDNAVVKAAAERWGGGFGLVLFSSSHPCYAIEALMVIHKLIRLFLRHGGGSNEFYMLQAQDAIRWLERYKVPIGQGRKVLDLGCGFGFFGGELAKSGCEVTLADDSSYVLPEYRELPFRQVDLEKDDLAELGEYDLVICSNVLEHLSRPEAFIDRVHRVLRPKGLLYLSWTNWLSPWGGHDFSPYHYLGPRRGARLYDWWTGRERVYTPYVDLFPTYIGRTLSWVGSNRHVRLVKQVPRYYPELGFLMFLPLLREFLAWNAVLLIERREDQF